MAFISCRHLLCITCSDIIMECLKRLTLSVTFTLFCISVSEANKVPYDAPCEELSGDCLRDSVKSSLLGFVKGNPSIGLKILDPFAVDKLDLAFPGGLKTSFYDGQAMGFRKCIVDHARLKNDALDIQLHCNLTLKGKYKSSGRLLLFPINGEGDSTIKCTNLRLNLMLYFGKAVGGDGEDHLLLRDATVNHYFDGPVFFRLTNLIKNNPLMSKTVLDFMNQNWKIVAEEFGKPIIDYGMDRVIESVNQLIKSVPLRFLYKTLT